MPSLILSFSLSHIAAAVDADRSPRPTSAPAIAQSEDTEVSKAQKETVKVEEQKEEVPPEQAEPEPTEAWKVSPNIWPGHFLVVWFF